MGTNTVVISLGGSIIVPDKVDVSFLMRFKSIIESLADQRFIIICGGGKVCRHYQDAARKTARVTNSNLDWIGIAATRLNAELVRSIFGEYALSKIIHDPHPQIEPQKRIIIGAGFEPGSSTDLRAVQLAERFDAVRVINMSNIDYAYSADPKKDPNAKRLTTISWPDFQRLVGDVWDPGLNMPFDPIASKEAARIGLEVIIIGNNVNNLEKLLKGNDFEGTTIS